jgi:hypothetical protein
MIALAALLLLAAPAAKAPPPSAPPELKAPANARALLGVTADGLTVFELEQVGDGPPEMVEALRFYSVHDGAGARVALFRKEHQEGDEKVKDPVKLWDVAQPLEEGKQWLTAHPLRQAEEVNLLLDQRARRRSAARCCSRSRARAATRSCASRPRPAPARSSSTPAARARASSCW